MYWVLLHRNDIGLGFWLDTNREIASSHIKNYDSCLVKYVYAVYKPLLDILAVLN